MHISITELRTEGNYLRKSKHTFNISAVCDRLTTELTYKTGHNRSNVIERAVRDLYKDLIGDYPPIDRRDVFHEREPEV